MSRGGAGKRRQTTAVFPFEPAVLPYGTLDPDVRPLRIEDIGHNCVSELTNDPTGRYPAVRVGVNLPVIPTTPLPTVRLADFDGYIKIIKAHYERMRKLHNELLAMNMADPNADHVPAPTTVPSVFFRDDFQIENPRDFDQVIDADLHNSALLQDKLSSYLDQVEVQITELISKRSDAFFEALNLVEETLEETFQALGHIHRLRTNITKLNDMLAVKPLQVVQLNQTRDNHVDLYEKLYLIAAVQEHIPSIEVLMASADYPAALQTIFDLKQVIHDELAGIRAVKAFVPMLDEMTSRVEQSAINDFVQQLLEPLLPVAGADALLAEAFGTDEDAMNADAAAQPSSATSQQIGAVGPATPGSATVLTATTTPSTPAAPASHPAAAAPANQPTPTATPAAPTTPSVPTAPAAQGAPVPLPSTAAAPLPTTRKRTTIMGADLLAPRPDQQMDIIRTTAPLIGLLMHQGKLSAALQVYRDKLLRLTKALVRESVEATLVSFTNIDATGEPGTTGDLDVTISLAQQLRELSMERYQTTLGHVYALLEGILKRAAITHTALLDIFSHLEPPTPSTDTPATSPAATKPSTLLSESMDVVHALCDLSHVRAAKLLLIRKENNVRLTPKDFYGVYQLTIDFITTTEQINGRVIPGLRGTLTAQAKGFVQTFHADKLAIMSMLLENEPWESAVVPREFQLLLDQLQKPSAPAVAAAAAASSAENGTAASTQVDYVLIGGHKCYVVSAVLMAIKFVSEYLNCATIMSVLSADILQRVVEFFDLFNKQTARVILGAGAISTAGLKTITSKHLALASQALDVLVLLIPLVQASLRERLPAKQAVLLGELDRVLHDVSGHQFEIFNKFVAIMDSRVIVHLRTWKSSTLWTEAPNAANTPSEALKNIVKDVKALYKMIKRYVTNENTQMILLKVFAVINKRLEEELPRLEVANETSRSRLLADLRAFAESLTGFETAGNVALGDKLVQLAAAMPLFVPKPAQTSATAPAAPTRKSFLPSMT